MNQEFVIDNTIKKLSTKIVNKISAGEVILSPVNVVKELLENSIDAMSTKIDIVLERHGRNLIKVTDNGIGISKKDLPLVIERYATSKLFEDDLLNIRYMGFRGEAMHSIAIVSRLSVISKHVNSDLAWKLLTDGGQEMKMLPAKLLCGTSIEVRDLFFSTPTKIKFLKSEKIELQYIIDVINKLALMHPQIQFSLISDEKKIIQYENCKDFKSRILQIKELKNDFSENICYQEIEENGYRVVLFVSNPTFNNTYSNFYIFVNKRPVYDTVINNAIKSAYYDYIPHNKFPTAIVLFSLPTDEIDVNIHPTKSAVKFSNVNHVKKFIFNAVTSAISQDKKFIIDEVSFKKSKSEFVEQNTINHIVNSNNKILEKNLNESYYNVDQNDVVKRNQYSKLYNSNLSDTNHNIVQSFIKSDNKTLKNNDDPYLTKNTNFLQEKKIDILEDGVSQSKLIKERNYKIKCQLYDTYIVVENLSEIILIDQHAAHERLLYENLKKNLNLESQIVLISEIIELSFKEIALLEENQELLNKIGLGLEKFGENLIVVHKIPVILKNFDIKSLIKNLLNDDFLVDKNLMQKIERVYANIACKNAIKANSKLSEEEMYKIVDDIESTNFSAQCNHGRPTYIKISKSNIEQMFERK